jgi:GntR family transcriptional regulator, transcriptional repressor for pyruvate dehydrogenase complex
MTSHASATSLAATLAEEWILSGRYHAGEKLPSERKIAEELGVSRPMVREALRGLLERRLIEISPGRGAFVRGASVSDVAQTFTTLVRRQQATTRDVLRARQMLECEAAELAAEHASKTDLATMLRELEDCESATGILERVRADLRFHAAVVNAVHNPVISGMYGGIASLTAGMMLRSLSDREVSREGLPYHRDIYGAIAERRPMDARAAAMNHLQVAHRSYGSDLDRAIDDVARRELSRMFGSTLSLDDLLTD